MRIVPVEPTKNDFYVIVETKTKRLCRVDIYNSFIMVFLISKSYISFRLAKFFSSVIPPHLHSLSKKPTESHSASLRGLITEDYPMATGRVLILILIGIQGPSAIRHPPCQPSTGDNELFWPSERVPLGFWVCGLSAAATSTSASISLLSPSLSAAKWQPKGDGVGWGGSRWPLASQNPQGACQGVKPAEPGLI